MPGIAPKPRANHAAPVAAAFLPLSWGRDEGSSWQPGPGYAKVSTQSKNPALAYNSWGALLVGAAGGAFAFPAFAARRCSSRSFLASSSR